MITKAYKVLENVISINKKLLGELKYGGSSEVIIKSFRLEKTLKIIR